MKKILYLLGVLLLAVVMMNVLGFIMQWLFRLVMVAIFATGIYFWGKYYLKNRNK